MSDQLNFKQVPFDTMYYNNLSKQGGQVLIECDPNRTVLKIIESCITKNNTVLSDAELAQWIFRYHVQRTKNHVELVKICATYLKKFFQFGGYFERFIANVQQHDYDKLIGNEHVASFALNAPLYKYKDLYEISPESKRVYEEIEWVKHHQLNVHHPEHYMRRVSEDPEMWAITDEEMEEFFKDKGGHPAALMAIGEMVADWAAVGIEMGDTAKEWWLKNKDTRWSYGPKYTQALEACLDWIPSKIYADVSEPVPEPPDLRKNVIVGTTQEGIFDNTSEEKYPNKHWDINDDIDVSLEKLFIKDEDLFNAIKKAQKITSKEKLAEVLKPGDLVTVYRHRDNMALPGKIVYNVSIRMQGSSFSSIKMIAKNPKQLYGYGVVMNDTGFKKVNTKSFLSSCSGCLVLRNPHLSEKQADKLFAWLDARVDKVEYSVLKLIKSVITHTFELPDTIDSKDAVNYTDPMFCSTIFAYAMVACGINHGLGFSSISTVWPKDFAVKSNWKPVYSYFEKAEDADVVLEKQEASAASYTLDVSTEGWFDPVVADGSHYTIRNFPVVQFFNKLRKEYKTTKLEHLFEVIGIRLFSANSRTIVIHRFFVPELLYLLNKYNFPKSLINTIQSNTWVGKPVTVDTTADMSLISKNINVKLYPHQEEFIKNYTTNKITNRLRGYLLSFEQGLGKTITALALMEGLKKKHVVIICPKNTMVETWQAHLNRYFVTTSGNVHVVGFTKGPLNPYDRWVIVNYERIDEVSEFLVKNKLDDLGIIVDESHNFLRTSSLRTQLLIDLAKFNKDADILLLSGTPLKSTGVEMVPMLHVLDPYFDEEALSIFKKTFGFNTNIANDVLSARLDRMMTRVKKDILELPEKKESTIAIRMPTGWKYTASQVEKEIVTFVKQRQDYYNQNLQLYISAFDKAIEWLRDEPTVGGQPEFQRYLDIIDELRESTIYDARGNSDIVWANQYEKDVLIPALPEDLRKQFIWSKSVVKYLPLKIKGEVIGQLLTRLRMQMTSEMMTAADLKQYVDKAMKKTVVFTSYVDTIELAYNYFKQEGYNPLAVYGKTASELTTTIDRFQNDQSLNPLIASLKMLSTGATLTAANTVIFLNKPWRSVEYQQASDRVHRIGQDTECEIISLVLDTGKEANLSTRMEEIMQWSGDQFDQIVDKKEREMLKKFFRGFESLDVPEDCTSGLEAISADTKSEDRGPISESDKKKIGKYIYHGTHRDLDIKNLGIHVCKNRANTNIKAPVVYMNRTLGVASLHVVPFMVGHGSKLQNYEEHFVNLEEAIRSESPVKHVEIVHNDPDLEECSGEQTGYIYWVEAKEFLDDLYYATPDKPNDWNFVSYRQLPIAKKTEVKVSWHKKYDPDFAKKVKSGFMAVEALESSPNAPGLRLYHLSYGRPVDSKTLIPRIPDNEFVEWGVEDGKTKRVCFSTSISKATLAMGRCKEGQELHVYEVDYSSVDKTALMKSIVTPTKDQVPDVNITKEVWCMTPIKVKYTKTIKLTSIKYEYTLKFQRKDGTEYVGHPREWNYEVVSIDSQESLGNQQWKTYDSLVKLVSEEDKIHFRSMCGEYLYHGSPLKYRSLSPQMRSDMDRPVLCVTPFMGIAAWFCAPETALGRGEYTRKRVQIKEWFDNQNNYDGVKEIFKTVHIHHNIRQIPNQTIKHTGYIHFIRTEDIINDIVPYNRWSRSMEGWYFGKPITPAKVVPIEITVVLCYDSALVKEAGGDAIPISSNESLSMEVSPSTPSKIAQKKKKILDFICKLCDTMEPSGLNSKRYRQIIGNMNDKEFDQFMNYMKEGKWQLHLVAPNMVVNLQNEDLLKACDLIGLNLFHKVWMYDKVTGRKYLTDNEYMFVKLPIRRQQQFLDEKISVPDNDRTIDGLTGQVTGDSRSCAITNPEIQILAARGLDNTLREMVNVRGGNIHGYNEFRRMLEENGEADLDTIDPNSKTRVSVVGKVLLQSMMIDTNL